MSVIATSTTNTESNTIWFMLSLSSLRKTNNTDYRSVGQWQISPLSDTQHLSSLCDVSLLCKCSYASVICFDDLPNLFRFCLVLRDTQLEYPSLGFSVESINLLN